MIRYRQYRPAFFEGFTDEEGTVPTLEELLKLEFIHSFSVNPHFHRFSLDHHRFSQDDPINLMAEYKEGREWWVVARLWPQGDELARLPKWEPVD